MEPLKIGRYALIKLIGRGGMADVWTGKVYGASGFEKIFAIKLLTPGTIDQEEYQTALTNEARLQVNLKHPNIVDVYDFNFDAENPYLVMEYVEGIELRRLLKVIRERKQKLPLALAAYVVSEISKALSHAHDRRHPQTGEPLHIVHRDISPSNILISVHGDVKLSDFGIAKSALQSNSTQVGQIKGKFRYMSPEQAEGKGIDHRSDIYSLGLVFYECLFGGPAYDDASDAKVLHMARTGIVSIPEDAPSELQIIFKELLAPNPEDRYPEMSSFRRDLSHYLQQTGSVIHREEVVEFLKELDLEELRQAVSARQQAEEWKPVPSAQVLDQTGRITLLIDEAIPKSRKKIFLISSVSVTAILAISFMAMHYFKIRETSSLLQAAPIIAKVTSLPVGTLRIDTNPTEAVVRIKYGNTVLSQPSPISLNEVPLGQTVEMNVSKKGFKSMTKNMTLTADKREESVKIVLEEVKDMQVKFLAEPYAEVSVPGIFNSVETPLSKTFLAGNYNVIFTHDPTGKKAFAKLNGSQGGNFTCTANMAVSDTASAATAICKPR